MNRFNKPPSRIATTGLIAIASAILLASSAAIACRDCPFPLKVSDHKWLMPKSDIVIVIDEQPISKIMTKITVELLNSNSGEVLARGSTIHGSKQRDIDVVLHDRRGHRVNGLITFVNFKEDVIQAAFECDAEDDDNCAIGHSL